MRQQVELSPSRYLALILIAAHGAAAAVPLLLLPLWAGALVASLLSLNLYHSLLRDAWWRLAHSCAGLVLEDAQAEIVRRDGACQPCRILPGSLVTPWLTVLNLLPEGARYACSVIILPDSLDAESFRRLRVWLKWSEHLRRTGAE